MTILSIIVHIFVSTYYPFIICFIPTHIFRRLDTLICYKIISDQRYSFVIAYLVILFNTSWYSHVPISQLYVSSDPIKTVFVTASYTYDMPIASWDNFVGTLTFPFMTCGTTSKPYQLPDSSVSYDHELYAYRGAVCTLPTVQLNYSIIIIVSEIFPTAIIKQLMPP